MILSRVWYVLLGAAVAVALYVVYVAVGQYNRQTTLALKAGLASDSQTVEWALKIDARRRLDALLAGSVDPTLQQSLVSANAAKDGKAPDKAKTDARKALLSVSENIPADWRPDALFAVDREGHVVAQAGYDGIAGNEDFELGGYPAVNDALPAVGFATTFGSSAASSTSWSHGLSNTTSPDTRRRDRRSQRGKQEVRRRSRQANANEPRLLCLGPAPCWWSRRRGFDEEKLDAVGNDLKNIVDKTYGDTGRSDVRRFSDDLGAMYARLPGDASTLGSGFTVVRGKTELAGPMSFLSTADDKDKANVPWLLLAAVVFLAAFIGIGLTVLEHTAPLNELVMQADRLKTGVMDGLQVARFRGAYRLAAQSLNQGMGQAIEKAGALLTGRPRVHFGAGAGPALHERVLLPDGRWGRRSAGASGRGRASAGGRHRCRARLRRQCVLGGRDPSSPSCGAATGEPIAGDSPRSSYPPFLPVYLEPFRPRHDLSRFRRPGRPANLPLLAPAITETPSVAAFEPDNDDGEDERRDNGQAVRLSSLRRPPARTEPPQEEAAEWLSVYEDFLRTKKTVR